MNLYIFGSLLAGFILSSLYIGTTTSKDIGDSDDYYLSSRKLTVFSLCLTFLATQLGGGVIVGAADAAYIYGWQAIYYAVGISLGLFGLSLGVGKRLREYQISTIPQIFKKRYNDPILYKLASIIYIISTFLILVAIAVATKKYLTSINCFNHYIFFTFWIALIIYTSIGGLKAVVKTDILQISGVLIIFFVTFCYLILFVDTNSAIATNTSNQYDSVPWSTWLLMPMFFTLIGQDMGQRCFAGASPKIVTKSTMLAGVLLLLTAMLPTYLGIIARDLGIELSRDTSVLMAVVSQLTNPILTSLFAFAVLMAIISTADSLLCAISSNIAIDLFSDQKDSKKVITRAKIITLVCGIAAYGVCLFTNDIIQIMLIGYELTIISFFVPIIIAIFSKKPSQIAARAACFVGILCYLLLPTSDFILPKEVCCLALSLIAYFITMYITKKHPVI